MTKKIKLVHVITTLDQGGAQHALFRIITSTQHEIDHLVVSLQSESFYGPKLKAAGVTVVALDFKPGKLTWRGIKLLRHTLKDNSPNIVQTWLYHADLIAGIIARTLGIKAVLWSLRNSTVHKDAKVTKIVVKLCALLSSRIPSHIISCSHNALRYHEQLGYQCTSEVIPNGFDINSLIPQPSLRLATRAELTIENRTVFGFIARWDPQKNHEFFLRVFSLWLASCQQDVQLLLVGDGCDLGNKALLALLNKFNLQDHVKLIGPRSDIPAIFNAIDITVLPSKSEAFPNVLAESMCCGTPCIASRVGDAEYIIDRHGWLVTPDDEDDWIRALNECVSLLQDQNSWSNLQKTARDHIAKNYNIDVISKQYIAAWKAQL